MRATDNQDGFAVRIATWTAILTLAIKAIGVGMATNEAFLVKPPRDSVIFALAAFMMAGATGLDHLVGAIFGQGKAA